MYRQTESVLIDIAGPPPDHDAVSFEEVGNSQLKAIGNTLYVVAIEEDVPVPSTARAASLASMARKHSQHIFGCVALDDHWLGRRFRGPHSAHAHPEIQSCSQRARESQFYRRAC